MVVPQVTASSSRAVKVAISAAVTISEGPTTAFFADLTPMLAALEPVAAIARSVIPDAKIPIHSFLNAWFLCLSLKTSKFSLANVGVIDSGSAAATSGPAIVAPACPIEISLDFFLANLKDSTGFNPFVAIACGVNSVVEIP